jgi:hypothetical protein
MNRLLIFSIVLGLALTARAADPDDVARENEHLRQRVAELEQRVKVLEKQVRETRERAGVVIVPPLELRWAPPAEPRRPLRVVPEDRSRDPFVAPIPAPDRRNWKEERFNGSTIYVIPLDEPASRR